MDPLKFMKTFRMHNTGTTPIKLTHIGIGRDGACKGGGFAVVNCGGEITIQPNKSRKLELSYVLLRHIRMYSFMYTWIFNRKLGDFRY